MSEFFVGQKVVCVDDRPSIPENVCFVKKGQIYEVAWVGEYPFSRPFPDMHPTASIRLVGITRPTGCPYSVARFRPLEEASKTIEQFREIARGVSNGKPIIEDASWRMPTPEKVKA